MTKVHVLWEDKENHWRIIHRKIKDNEIIISRKRKILTNEKYRFGMPRMCRVNETLNVTECESDLGDCQPIPFMYKSLQGRIFGIGGWRLSLLYKATYKSHKIQPFGKNTIVPMDPVLYKQMSEDNAIKQALERNKGQMLMGFVLGAAMFFMVGYILGPTLSEQLKPQSPVAENVTRVVKGAVVLWMMPRLRSLRKR